MAKTAYIVFIAWIKEIFLFITVFLQIKATTEDVSNLLNHFGSVILKAVTIIYVIVKLRNEIEKRNK